MSMWQDIGKTLANIGLPLLGTAIGGPAGGMIGKGLASALGLEGASEDELLAKINKLDPDTLLALKKFEADNQRELQQMAMDYDKLALAGQVDLAKADQASGSNFRAGWRPMVGWICTAGLAYTFLFRPLFPWVVKVGALIVGDTATVPDLPPIDMGELFILLMGMLGLGGARTFEKVKGLD